MNYDIDDTLRDEYELCGTSLSYKEWLESEVYSLRTQIMFEEVEKMLGRKQYLNSFNHVPALRQLNND